MLYAVNLVQCFFTKRRSAIQIKESLVPLLYRQRAAGQRVVWQRESEIISNVSASDDFNETLAAGCDRCKGHGPSGHVHLDMIVCPPNDSSSTIVITNHHSSIGQWLHLFSVLFWISFHISQHYTPEMLSIKVKDTFALWLPYLVCPFFAVMTAAFILA